MDPRVQSGAEPEGYEFGYCAFDQLPAVDVNSVQMSSQNEQNGDISCDLPIQPDVLIQLQWEGAFCQHVVQQVGKGKVKEGHLCRIDGRQLEGVVGDGDGTYGTVVVLGSLVPQVLHMAHGGLGHGGAHGVCVLLEGLCYWRGLGPGVGRHIGGCPQCWG